MSSKGTRVRNPEIIPGVRKYSRAQAVSKTGKWRFLKKGPAGKKTPKKEAPAAPAQSRFYEAEDAPKPLKKRNQNATRKIAKLRKGVEPGTVLIVLAGRFRGKRVVFLKQLQKSGLLLVTGPFDVNGVPLRRINQAYTIATSVKVSMAGVQLPADLDDTYFKRVENDEKLTPNAERYAAWISKRKTNQKSVDAAILKNIEKEPLLKDYLGARFSLSNGQAPHLMKF
jgi:large subunit ribosomal protein L6e